MSEKPSFFAELIQSLRVIQLVRSLNFRIEEDLMSSEHSSDMKFEIGHVLFIDIVGYSKLLINEQSEQIQTLRKIVRGTDQFRLAEAAQRLQSSI